jgi:hypothetical protein
MTPDPLDRIRSVRDIPALIAYLRDELDWPIGAEDFDELTFEYEPEELGIDARTAARIEEIKQLRPLAAGQPWGVFFIRFEPKRLPVGALRSILRSFVRRTRQQASAAHRQMWDMEDLLFLCSHRQEDQDAVTFVHFAQPHVEGRAARLTSFGWTEDSHNRTVLEFNLPPLRWPDNTVAATDWRNQWLRAFDKQRLTEVFFKEYQALFTILQNDFSKQTKDTSWAHDYALQFLNRVMFLYFIQRKRWLDGDPDFLKTFWSAYGSAKQPPDTFFEKWLKVMFFEEFNNRFHGGHEQFPREIKKALQLAPYLNGGLFEENDLDRKHSFTINDERFLQVLTFLERYNFTVSEDTPLDQEVAVDAEMLGRVYESLVNLSKEADERGDAGIFYTPRTEIDLMCRLALVDHMANHIGEQCKALLYEAVFAFAPDDKRNADNRLERENLWVDIDALLQRIAVVDPACGSGSFLIGMLQALDDLSQRANRGLGRQETPYERRKRIIGQSLYGVDVMRWAVEVAELRLWLQLVIETDLQPAELKFRPLLPNLSFKVRCGDSLVQELGGINIGHIRGTADIPASLKGRLTRLKGEKLKYYNNDKDAKFRSREAIEKEEYDIFRDILEAREYELDNRLKKKQQQKPPDKTVEMFDDERHNTKEKVRSALDALRHSKTAPFVWDVAFVEIFKGDRQGFDIVIGNPPYVRQENISDPQMPRDQVTTENKKEYKAKLAKSVYQTYSSFFGYKAGTDAISRKMNAKSDLYIYFYFHGLSLLNDKGTFCFITSNSWLDVGYGADLQEFLLNQCHVKMVLDNQSRRSFASAAVNTVIALFSPPSERREWGLERTARFIMFKVPFEQILSPVVFEEIEATAERKSTPEYRVFPIRQDRLLEDGCELPEDEETGATQRKKPDRRASGPLIKVARYIGNKWGGKYLRAPDIYWTVIEKGRGRLVRLCEVALVRRGFTSGANEFFYLDDETRDRWRIEKQFLRPLFKGPKDVTAYEMRARDLSSSVFYCTTAKKDLTGTNALRYIAWGEQAEVTVRQGSRAGTRIKGFHRLATLQNRNP